jgi:hypothetical protein
MINVQQMQRNAELAKANAKALVKQGKIKQDDTAYNTLLRGATVKQAMNAQAKKQQSLPTQNGQLLSELDQRRLDNEKFIKGIVKQAPAYQSTTNNAAFKNLQNQAFGAGPNPLFEQQRAAAQAALGTNLDNQAQAAAGARANTYSDLAMGGGLSSGARERVAASNIFGDLANRQQTRAASDAGMRDIGIKEVGAKQDLQKQIAEGLAKDSAGRNDYLQNKYKLNSALQAGGRLSADQMQAADKLPQGGGSYICGAVAKACGPHNEQTKMALGAFYTYCEENHPEEFKYYHDNVPALVSRMEAGGYDFSKLQALVEYTTLLVLAGHFEAAFTLYYTRAKQLEMEGI